MWNQEVLAEALVRIRYQQGRLTGRMESLGFPIQQETLLQVLTQDVVKSSEIEGEMLDLS